MSTRPLQLERAGLLRMYAEAAYDALAPRAYSVIMFGALFCNLAVKFFHAVRYGLLFQYWSWILTDIAVLLILEVILTLICYRRPTKRVVRGVTIFAAVVCTWSVINAAWVIRTGTQILPMELLPLIRDPVNIFWMVLHNLASMPGAAAVLLVPSAIALAFLFAVLVRPQVPSYSRHRLKVRVAVLLAISAVAAMGNTAVSGLGSAQIAAAGLRFNCQSRAVLAFLLPRYRHLAGADFSNATRQLPRFDQFPISFKPPRTNHNVVIVVLEGVQYDCTSLASEQGGIAPQRGSEPAGLTPYLASLADQGVSFINARSVVTHTTKALFALLTGQTPSASQDIAETVPMDRPYASLATILEKGLGFRTAFFQSATGTFESRPGLIHNLGFDKFSSREDLDPNQFVGYLGCDEFAMLDPITAWIRSEDKPFLLVALCSVTHDPYEVPAWYGERADEIVDRYLQTISYTDQFLAAMDNMLADLNLTDDTIFCVVGDHGEAFGEHQGMRGHDRISFEEVLRIAMCMRAPSLIEPGMRVVEPVSSVDFTPTILGLLGFDVTAMDFDGTNALEPLPKDRRVYFSGWMHQGPAGFVQQDHKFVYNPENSMVSLYRLSADPLELSALEVPEEQAEQLSRQIIAWRRNTIFQLDQQETGNTTLFDSWSCKWNGRISTVRHMGR